MFLGADVLRTCGADPIIRDIPGFPNYQISEDGVVYNKISGKELWCGQFKNKYMYVNIINNNSKRMHMMIHRLLAITFIDNPENKEYVDHIDRNRVNNNLNNLRWSTLLENSCNNSLDKRNKTGKTGVIRILSNKWYFYRAYINRDKKTYTKNFPYTPEGLELAKEWRRSKELELFGTYAPN